MVERDETHKAERQCIWSVAVRVVDDALRARVVGQLQASGETELALEAAWNAADVTLTDDATLGRTIERATVLLTDELSLAHAALAAGVVSVLPTHVSRGALLAAVAAAARGLAALEPALLSRLVHESAWPLPDQPLTAQRSLELTAREREVLTLLAEGASNKVIARRLGISVHTVKYHVASILEKLDATGRTDAVAHAVRLGLILL
ncbi:MAG: helix-turn-helix transcriptional regulator [Thermomicrobiales bacterium]|jgi:DNA-binding NarL/FixJ family response regulator|nr:helix-turn-helix transcriptional regulator [Thermomicrobiales bacterium]